MKYKIKMRIWTRDAFILQEACMFLGLARLMTMMKFRQFAPFLGKKAQHEPEEPSDDQLARAQKVKSAILAMSVRTPWKSRCLVRAIAAQIMLRRRRINCTLYLGVAKNDAKRMKAHAWVKCGKLFLTGERPAGDYTYVAAFSNEFNSPGRSGEGEAG